MTQKSSFIYGQDKDSKSELLQASFSLGVSLLTMQLKCMAGLSTAACLAAATIPQLRERITQGDDGGDGGDGDL